MKTKFKISQLAAKSIDIDLEHPKHGKTGIILKLVGPHSQTWRDAFAEYQKTNDEDVVAVQAANAKLLAASIVGWDEDDFDEKYSPEAAARVLSDPANEWITAQVQAKVFDTSLFFQ